MSAEVTNIATALARAQARISDPLRKKDGQARASKYKYAPLDEVFAAVRQVLAEEGIAITQTVELVTNTDGAYILNQKGVPLRALRTSLLFKDQRIDSVYPLQNEGTMQDQGSELTYVRRYSLEAIAGVSATLDDDAMSISGGPRVRPDPLPPSAKPEVATTKQLIRAALDQRGFGSVTAEQFIDAFKRDQVARGKSGSNPFDLSPDVAKHVVTRILSGSYDSLMGAK